MRRRVYLETTVVSYLTARPSRTVITAAHQQITMEWWERRRHDFDLVVSELVLREAEGGDPEMARRRLALLAGLPRLALPENTLLLAREFVQKRILPEKAAEDGLHIAVATILALPFICTPEELLGGDP